MRINLNHMARRISKKEAGKKEVDIAQIKEVMKLMLEELADEKTQDVTALLVRYR